MALRPGLQILSLCSGVAGLELGIKLVAPAARVVCYLEREIYAAAILAARMEEGHLDAAPIYSDLATFDARAWRGKVDLVTAGYPCQPYSQAGKRRYEADKRHLWPEIARIVGECEPSFVFLENVNKRAFAEPWRDLRAMGFTLPDPFACTAAELGAGHRRRRVFALAYRDEALREQPWWRGRKSRKDSSLTGRIAWWDREPRLERLVHGAPSGVDRHRAAGEGVAPAMAAFAFSRLVGEVMS